MIDRRVGYVASFVLGVFAITMGLYVVGILDTREVVNEIEYVYTDGMYNQPDCIGIKNIRNLDLRAYTECFAEQDGGYCNCLEYHSEYDIDSAVLDKEDSMYMAYGLAQESEHARCVVVLDRFSESANPPDVFCKTDAFCYDAVSGGLKLRKDLFSYCESFVAGVL